ncbi:methyl-accepting chemotaxis protein [Stenotrophomonas sp. NPDC077659]|uniref:methyl-accepting chemotaxis protein n=1 Tax=Stenotrophomonas sp. NPDC077659 TaxID=3390694 RepID=UPI003D060738
MTDSSMTNGTTFRFRALRNTRISTRLHLINIAAVIGLAAICVYAGMSTRASLMEERRHALSDVMDATLGTLRFYVQQEQSGALSREVAQQRALAMAHEIHYGEGNYIWINHVIDAHQAKRLMNGGNDKFVGSVANSPADAEFIRLVRESNGGVINQEWPRPGTDKPVPKITEVRGVKEWNWIVGSGVYVDDLDRVFWTAMGRLGLIFLVVWAALTAAVVLISRSIILPLREATNVAGAIADGRLDNAISEQGNNEVGLLLGGMGRMQAQLKAVMNAQSDMAREHDAGMIRFRMDDHGFSGEFATMVRETNALVDAHVQTQMHLMDIMGQYAKGDLTHNLRDYPGDKHLLTETMAGVKRNLQAINGEIGRLSNAASQGDFSQRGDVDRFEYDFRRMVDALNTMIGSADENLSRISQLLGRIAEGDLTARIDGEFKGVFARMRDDANATAENLTKIVSEIQSVAGNISGAASEIAAGNDELSKRSERQAADLEETAASMEELTSTVQQNASSSQQADAAAKEASRSVARAADAIGDTERVMADISESSARIGDIISVIDGIAFQTNILALNAAVEAARAGEHGRGFAVVASEVRTLAQRCAVAAKEIASLIQTSGERVEQGRERSAASAAAIADVLKVAARTTALIDDIAAASAEQAAGIEQVNQAVISMDQTTQQNAALVEEAMAAAKQLESQSQVLVGAVSAFKVA